MIKVITLQDPWAQLIARGLKVIETRSWRTYFTGPIAIHSSKSLTLSHRQMLTRPEYAKAFNLQVPLAGGELFEVCAEWPRGAVVATADLIGCLPTESLPYQGLGMVSKFSTKVFPIDERERAFGNYEPGRFAWILENVNPLPAPIEVKGRQGLWSWDVTMCGVCRVTFMRPSEIPFFSDHGVQCCKSCRRKELNL